MENKKHFLNLEDIKIILAGCPEPKPIPAKSTDNVVANNEAEENENLRLSLLVRFVEIVMHAFTEGKEKGRALYKLIEFYSHGKTDDSDAHAILEACILKRYLVGTKGVEKVNALLTDKDLTQKFLNDLRFETLDFFKREWRIKDKEEKTGILLNKEKNTNEDKQVQSLDYIETDLLHLIESVQIKTPTLSKYLACNYNKLEKFKTNFTEATISITGEFNVPCTTINKYYACNNTNPSQTKTDSV